MNPTEKATAEISPTEIISLERNAADGTKERQLWKGEWFKNSLGNIYFQAGIGTMLLMTQVSPLVEHSLHQRKKKHNLIAKVYFTKVSK